MTITKPLRRWLRLTAPLAALASVLAVAAPAWASTVHIQDDSNVLNATIVQNDAATLPVPVYIWSTTQDAANMSAFDTDVSNKVGTTYPIVIGINTQSHHASIHVGAPAGLSRSAAVTAASSANSAFDGTMRNNHNYTAAVVSTVDSLRNSLASARSSVASRPGRSTGGTIFVIVLLVVGLIVVVAIGSGVRRAFGGRSRPTMFGGPPPMGPYPGYGPQYPGYGPGYQSGMSPGAAGAFGAVGGGLLGYELGKMEGERQQFRDDQLREDRYDNGQNGSYDQGNWEVGQDSDFGDPGNQSFDSSGGGDSGGGGGGGGDW